MSICLGQQKPSHNAVSENPKRRPIYRYVCQHTAAIGCTSASKCATSASKCATSASKCATSASKCATSASKCATSASKCATSASKCATSASKCATSASKCATSASKCATSASKCATSASKCATSASKCATSARHGLYSFARGSAQGNYGAFGRASGSSGVLRIIGGGSRRQRRAGAHGTAKRGTAFSAHGLEEAG